MTLKVFACKAAKHLVAIGQRRAFHFLFGQGICGMHGRQATAAQHPGEFGQSYVVGEPMAVDGYAAHRQCFGKVVFCGLA